MKVNKGDRVVIVNNSILNKAMGIPKATGTVFLVYPDGHGFSFKCDQTRSLETVDFGDGQIELERK